MHSVDCIEGNSKSGVKFWGVITDSYNNTTEAHHHHTVNNLCSNRYPCSIKFIIKNIRTGKAEPTMTWFLRSQSSDTRIGLIPNSSASTGVDGASNLALHLGLIKKDLNFTTQNMVEV
jgi:hypothetical protein